MPESYHKKKDDANQIIIDGVNKYVPTDKGNTVYKIFFLWGIGVLLPWNCILNVFDFLGNEVSRSY